MKWLYRKLWHLFWRTLCPTPDRSRLHSWWYHNSGNIARYFYRKANGIRQN